MNEFSRPEPTHQRTLRVQRDRLTTQPTAPVPDGAHLELSLGRLWRDTHRTRVQVLRLTRTAASVHLTDGSDFLRGHLVELLAASGLSVTWQPLADPAAADDDSEDRTGNDGRD